MSMGKIVFLRQETLSNSEGFTQDGITYKVVGSDSCVLLGARLLSGEVTTKYNQGKEGAYYARAKKTK